eukprot:scaffold53016_cov60-Attheya_sp.AAC.1
MNNNSHNSNNISNSNNSHSIHQNKSDVRTPTSPLRRAKQEFKDAFNCTGTSTHTAGTNTGIGMDHPGRGVNPNNNNNNSRPTNTLMTSVKERQKQFQTAAKELGRQFSSPPRTNHNNDDDKNKNSKQPSSSSSLLLAPPFFPHTSPRSKRSQRSQKDDTAAAPSGPDDDDMMGSKRKGPAVNTKHATPPEGGKRESPSTPKGRWRAPPQSHSISFRPSYVNLDLKRHQSPKQNTTDPIDSQSLLTHSSDGDESSRKELTETMLPILRPCVPSSSLEPHVVPASQRGGLLGGLGGGGGDRSIASSIRSSRSAEPEFISMRSRLRRSPQNDDPLPPSGREKKQEIPDSKVPDSKVPVPPVHPLASSGSIALQKYQANNNSNNNSTFIVRSHGSTNTNKGRPQKVSNLHIDTSSDVDAAPLSPISSSWQPVHLSPGSGMGGCQDIATSESTNPVEPCHDTSSPKHVPFQSWRRPTAHKSKEVSVRKDPASWMQRHDTGKEKDPREILQLPDIELNAQQNHTQPIIKNYTRTPTPHESLTNAILTEIDSGDAEKTEEDSYLTLEKEEVEAKEKKEQKSLPAWKKRLPSPSQPSKGNSAQDVAIAGRQQKWESSLSPPPQIVRSRQQTTASRWTPPKQPISANRGSDRSLSKANAPSPTNLMRWKHNSDGRFVRAPVIEETKNTTIEQPQAQ